MVRSRLLLGLAGAAAVLLVVWAWSGGDGTGLPLTGRRTPPPLPDPLPRIGLDRIGRELETGPTGRRDVFAFGPLAPQATPPPPPRQAATGPVVAATPRPAPASAAEGGQGAPSMNVSFIGVVEAPGGLKVAVLEAEGRDVLTGREGDLVANRLEIVRIGLESLDVRDVGSERVRRLPLEGAR